MILLVTHAIAYHSKRPQALVPFIILVGYQVQMRIAFSEKHSHISFDLVYGLEQETQNT